MIFPVRAVPALLAAFAMVATGCGSKSSPDTGAGLDGGRDSGPPRDALGSPPDSEASETGAGDAASDAGDAHRPEAGPTDARIDAGSTLAIVTQPLPAAIATTPYSGQIMATGGTAPYRFRVASGALPDGVVLDLDGRIVGTPAAAGAYAFNVQATDSSSPVQTASAALSLSVRAPVSGMLEISTFSLPNGTVGGTYSATVTAIGGHRPYFWSVGSGALPPGIMFTPFGVLKGTPTTPGFYVFTIHIADISSPTMTADAELAIDVLQSSDSLQVSTVSVPGGVTGIAYTATLAASGGRPPYTWTLAAGVLPVGLSLHPSGNISGTPLDLGVYRAVVQVADSGSPPATAMRAIAIEIDPPALTILSASLPFGIINTVYSATIAVSGGVPPYSFTIDQGMLEAGLHLDPVRGTIRGSATAQGMAPVTIRVTDSSEVPMTASQAYTLTIYPPRTTLLLTTGALADAVQGHPYTLQFTAQGGWVPYHWTLVSGSLPQGLTLASDGTLQGTPAAVGTASFSVQVTDSEMPAQTLSGPFTVRVFAPLAVTAPTLPEGMTNSPYSATLGATGGISPYTFTVSSGMLPAGLQLSSSGVISGMPSAAGTYGFSVTVSDQAVPPQSAILSLSITVVAQLQITTATLPGGTVGVSYAASPAATGGVPPYGWFVSAGALPNGLMVDTSSGRIFGSPASSGTFMFTLGVGDSEIPAQAAFQPLQIVVAPPSVALMLTTTALPTAVIGTAYSSPLSAVGGDPPYAFSIQTGALPSGLSIDPVAGVISGMPGSPGTSAFTARVVDQEVPVVSSTAQLSISVVNPLAISTASLPNGVTGTTYSAQLGASGGTAPYLWSITSGALPMGVMLNASTGALSGTPSSPGTYSFTVSVSDSSNPVMSSNTSLSITVAALLMITNASLPNTTIGGSYSNQVMASGGTTPYTFSVSSGTLPPGLMLDPTNGHISGMPSTTGHYTFTISVSDVSTPVQTVMQQYMIAVNGAGTLTVSTGMLPGGVNGTAYSTVLAATGGTTPYTWSIAQGTLPAGLTLDAPSGTISGTPTMNGTVRFTVMVTDNSVPQQTATLQETIIIASPLMITTSSPPGGVLQRAYASAFAATGGTAPFNWSISAMALPPGILLDARSGQLTGAPSMVGTFMFTVQCVDSAVPPQTTTRMLQIVVTNPVAVTTAGLAVGSVNSMYSQTLAATGGTPPYAWTVAQGNLPAGLMLTSAGVLSGTPTANGTFALTIQVTDTSVPPQVVNRAFNLQITGALAVATTSLPNATTGVNYLQALAANGGLTPYMWTVTGGMLPQGVGLNISGNLQGMPTTAGTYNFTVSVADNSMPTQHATAMLSLVVTDSGFTITTSALNTAVNAQPYTMTLMATGGTMPYTWSITNGIPPAGIAFTPSNATLSGNTTANGNYPLTFQVQDNSTPRITSTRMLALAVVNPLEITTMGLADAISTRNYAANEAATGGTVPYAWSISAGSLPPGMVINAMNGTINGTSTNPGTYNFTVAATDGSIPPLVAHQALSIRVNPVLAINAMALPQGMVNTAYSAGENAMGGVTPYTWSVGMGALPPGLAIDPNSGIISGTPTMTGLFTFTLRVTDTSNPPQQATVNLNLRVN